MAVGQSGRDDRPSDFFEWLEERMGKPLNERQREAVRAAEGAVLVSAGAGTGKTTMITAKAAYLIKEKGISPERLLMLTFSRDAAAHMKDTLESAMPEARDVCASTFHAFCYDFLRYNHDKTGIEGDYRILETADAEFMLFRELEIAPGLVGNYIASIQKAKDLGLSFSDYERYLAGLERQMTPYVPEWVEIDTAASAAESRINTAHLEPKSKQLKEEIAGLKKFILLYRDYRKYSDFLEAWKGYERLKAAKMLLDYADMIKMVIDYARRWGEEELSGLFDYVIVDEFQDSNRQQFELLKIVTAGKNAVTVVGDVDQSIYAFRGAYPENMGEFAREFDAETLSLTDNYRSTDRILRTAHRLIGHNYQSPEEAKLLTSVEHIEGEPVRLISAVNQKEQARRVVDEIITLADNGVSYDEIAILFRSYSSVQAIRQALERRDVPYQLAGSEGFLKRPEIRTALAYLYVIANLENPLFRADPPWWRLLHYRYGLSMKDTHILAKAVKRGGSIQDVLMGALPAAMSEDGKVKIGRLIVGIDRLRNNKNKTLPDLLLDIYDLSGLSREFNGDGDRETRMAMRNLKALHDLVSGFQAFYSTDLPGFIDYIEMLDQLSDDLEIAIPEKSEGVVLKTCHGAKGLEYEHVYIIDMAKDKFPITSGGREHLIPDELNDRLTGIFLLPEGERKEALATRKRELKITEERRLAYVAFTRAKRHLNLCFAKSYGENERPPSQFVSEACFAGDEVYSDIERVEDIDDKTSDDHHESDLDLKKREIKKRLLSSIDSEPRLALYDLLLYQQLCGKPIPLDCPEAVRAAAESKSILETTANGMPRGTEFNPLEVRFSHSALKTYRECPKKFELQYLLRMPSRLTDGEGGDALNFGTFVHETLENAVKRKVTTREAIDEIAKELARTPEFTGVDLQRAKGIFDVFWARNKDTLMRSIMIEYMFNFQLDGFTFTGKIDRIDQINGNGEVEIIDYKTGGEPSVDDRESQFTLYTMALKYDRALKERKLVPKAVTLELLEQEKPRTFELAADGTMVCVGGRCKAIDVDTVQAMLMQTVKNIVYDYEHGFGVAEECGNGGGGNNSYCPYRMYCPKWG